MPAFALMCFVECVMRFINVHLHCIVTGSQPADIFYLGCFREWGNDYNLVLHQTTKQVFENFGRETTFPVGCGSDRQD